MSPTPTHPGLEALQSAESSTVSGAGNLLVSVNSHPAMESLPHPTPAPPLPRPQASYISLIDKHMLAAQVVTKLGKEVVLRILQVGGRGMPFSVMSLDEEMPLLLVIL